jgi:hypothetical protein
LTCDLATFDIKLIGIGLNIKTVSSRQSPWGERKPAKLA